MITSCYPVDMMVQPIFTTKVNKKLNNPIDRRTLMRKWWYPYGSSVYMVFNNINLEELILYG